MTTLSEALDEINDHGLVLTPALIASLQATVDARNAAAAATATRKRKEPPTDTISIFSSSSEKENNNPNPNPNLTDTDPDTDPSDSSSDSETDSDTNSISSEDPRLASPKWTCGQVRAKIRKFVEKDKTMQVGEFQRAIGVSGRSYYAFLKQNGPWKGAESSSFINAHRFFMKREILEGERKERARRVKEKERRRKEKIKAKEKRMKEKAKAKGKAKGKRVLTTKAQGQAQAQGQGHVSEEPVKKPKTSTSTATSTSTSAAATKQAKAEEFARRYDVSMVSLQGEETASVEVYDHCDEVRRKIRALLRSDPSMTRAAFCREISKTFPERAGDKSKALQGSTLASFLSKSGRREGRTSLIFYAAYVFFEKLRIRDGKPKTELREEMEDVWGLEGGFDIRSSTSQGYICSVKGYIYCDEYGRVRSGMY
ncbi:hypothetical protein BJX76DRAFT_324447 [Aspergillus varians]